MTFDEVVAFYVSATTHRSKWRDECSLRRLYPHFKGQRIDHIKRADLRRYIRHREADGVKLATIRRELVLLSAAINHARIELECELPNPVRSLGLPLGEERTRWLNKPQAKKLLAAADKQARRPHLPMFIRLALSTGCRAGELFSLDWSRIDFDQKQLYLEPRHTKNSKRRTVPLNPMAMLALDKMKAWQEAHVPLSPWVFSTLSGRHITSLKKPFRVACEAAGIDDFRVHDLRHTCASWLVMEGVSLYVVRELLGHSSITVTERYAHLAPDQTRAAVDLLRGI